MCGCVRGVWFQNPPRFLVALNLIGKEHRPELTRHNIERSSGKRQRQSIGLLPRDVTIIWLPRRGMIEHGLIEIGRCDSRFLWKAKGYSQKPQLNQRIQCQSSATKRMRREPANHVTSAFEIEAEMRRSQSALR